MCTKNVLTFSFKIVMANGWTRICRPVVSSAAKKVPHTNVQCYEIVVRAQLMAAIFEKNKLSLHKLHVAASRKLLQINMCIIWKWNVFSQSAFRAFYHICKGGGVNITLTYRWWWKCVENNKTKTIRIKWKNEIYLSHSLFLSPTSAGYHSQNATKSIAEDGGKKSEKFDACISTNPRGVFGSLCSHTKIEKQL